jgi:polar amino acid transport system substrate-binding protein
VHGGWRIAAALVLASGLLAACGDGEEEPELPAGLGEGNGNGDGDTLEQARERGSITIGFANENPYGFQGPDGEPTGQAPEVAKEVLSRMGIDEVEGVVVEFGSLIPGLNAGRFDIIAAGMFINEERAQQVRFSDPDYCGTTAFGVEAGNPLGIETFDDVAENPEVDLGVLGGAVEDDYATGSGVPEGQIQRFADTPTLFDALAAGRIDAAALTALTVRQQIDDLGDEGLEATDGFVPVIDGEEQLGCGAYAFRNDDEDLRDEFNQVLNEMKEAGEILPIVEEFGFTEAEIDAAEGVTVEDLVGEG